MLAKKLRRDKCGDDGGEEADHDHDRLFPEKQIGFLDAFHPNAGAGKHDQAERDEGRDGETEQDG